MVLTRPAWLEIDLDKLAYNYGQIIKLLPEGTDMMAVVKADAYGHGAAGIAKALVALGVKRFGVAHLSEALNIKQKTPYVQILVMGYTPDYLAEEAIKNGIRVTIFLKEQAEHFARVAKRINMDAIIHLKIETGMNRLGFLPNEETIKIIQEIKQMDNIIVEGIFTHFPAADDDEEYTRNSMGRFQKLIAELDESDISIPIKHVNNSAAIMNFPEFSLDMVRAGIIIYGIYPYPEADRTILPLKSCLSLKAQISHVKELLPGEKISYGLTYEAKNQIRVATIPLGYADGWSRSLSNKGVVLVKGIRVPIIGRICMDQMMVDVTGIDVRRGDEAVLMGSQEDQEITIYEVADQIGQIPAAVLCMFTRRLPRVYIKENRLPEVVDYLLE